MIVIGTDDIIYEDVFTKELCIFLRLITSKLSSKNSYFIYGKKVTQKQLARELKVSPTSISLFMWKNKIIENIVIKSIEYIKKHKSILTIPCEHLYEIIIKNEDDDVTMATKIEKNVPIKISTIHTYINNGRIIFDHISVDTI
jgi:hypothetical protein